MEPIIPKVDARLVEQELTDEFFVRPTNKAGNLIYDISAEEAPNTMREIARLREESYRPYGGSSGKAMDIDSSDTMTPPYRQILVWDPDAREIVGGYRYILGKDVRFKVDGQPRLSSAHIFRYSEQFIREFLPYGVEFGRAFVQPLYTNREAGMKALFALDNIWDGIGALILKNKLQFLFGKVTTHPTYPALPRDLLFAYLERYFGTNLNLVQPKQAHHPSPEALELAQRVLTADDAASDLRNLQLGIRETGSVLSPMFSAYLNLTNRLFYFGSAENNELSGAIESGIMIDVNDIYPDKMDRYTQPYLEWLKQQTK